MEETILNAVERTEKPKKVRAAGFIPGVLSGDSISKADSVQFNAADLNKLLAKRGSSAKLWIKYGSTKKFGVIKEVQRHPVEGKVIHVEIQLLSQNQEIKMQVPITFHGRNELERKRLLLQVQKSEIEILGKADAIPDVVIVNVSNKEQGDTVTVEDFELDSQLQVQDREDETYAVITALQEYVEEEPEEADEAVETQTDQQLEQDNEAQA